jgi:L-threonylcarbamoyladenylate synthase
VTAGTGRIGVRVPAHAVPRALCAAARSLLTATSANLSGHPAPQHAEEVMTAIGDSLDMLLDAGPTSGGPPSTIVDVTGRAARLVRAGAVPWERIEACLRPT